MRLRKNLPKLNRKGVGAIVKWLDSVMSEPARKHRNHAEAVRRTADAMTQEQRDSLKEMRRKSIELALLSPKVEFDDALRFKLSLGHISAMNEKQYTAIVNDAVVAGIGPGQPFINVCINWAAVRYVKPVNSFDDIKAVLSRHRCLDGKKISKTYNIRRDVWILYTTLGGKMKRVGEVFGLDLAELPEYVQKYVRPADARGPGRPKKLQTA